MQKCGFCNMLSGVLRRAMCINTRQGSSESYYRELGDQETLKIEDRSSILSDDSDEIMEDTPVMITHAVVTEYEITRRIYMGRFLTMHKRRKKRLVTRSLSLDTALLDDLQFGQVQCILRQTVMWNFNAFTLENVSGGRCLPVLCVHLFEAYGLISYFKLDIIKAWKLFILIEEGYRSTNPYHNAIHAADVTQAMHCFLQQKEILAYMEPLEIMASLLAAIAHDMDHPGVNQPFLITTSNHLAALYKNTSVLENHHWRAAMSCIIESGLLDEHDFYGQLKQQISSLILATDISRQQEFLHQFKTYLDTNTLDLRKSDHRHLVLQIAIKCADISNPCRPWEISKKWSLKVCDEFFRQGDYERKLKLPITALCDRSSNTIPKIQTGFFKYVVTPLITEWHRFLQNDLSTQMMENLVYNQNQWEILLAREIAAKARTTAAASTSAATAASTVASTAAATAAITAASTAAITAAVTATATAVITAASTAAITAAVTVTATAAITVVSTAATISAAATAASTTVKIEDDIDICSGTNISDSSELLIPRRSSLNPSKQIGLKEQLRRLSVPMSVFQDTRAKAKDKGRDSLAVILHKEIDTPMISECSIRSQHSPHAVCVEEEKILSKEQLLPDSSIMSLTTPIQASRINTVIKEGESCNLSCQQTFLPLEMSPRNHGLVGRPLYMSNDEAVCQSRVGTDLELALNTQKRDEMFNDAFKNNFAYKSKSADASENNDIDVTTESWAQKDSLNLPLAKSALGGRRESMPVGNQLRDNLSSVQLSSSDQLILRRKSMPTDTAIDTPKEKKVREVLPQILRRTLSGKDCWTRRRGSAPAPVVASELKGLASLGAIRQSTSGGHQKPNPMTTCQQWLAKTTYNAQERTSQHLPRRSSLPVEVFQPTETTKMSEK